MFDLIAQISMKIDLRQFRNFVQNFKNFKNHKIDHNFWTIRTTKILDPDFESSWKSTAYETICNQFRVTLFVKFRGKLIPTPHFPWNQKVQFWVSFGLGVWKISQNLWEVSIMKSNYFQNFLIWLTLLPPMKCFNGLIQVKTF